MRGMYIYMYEADIACAGTACILLSHTEPIIYRVVNRNRLSC